MEVRAHFYIEGNVQGVFFRRSAKMQADKLRVVGLVRNRRDGSVEIIAQGSKSKVDAFIKWCKKGPPFSKVEKVEIEWKKNLEDFEEFEVV